MHLNINNCLIELIQGDCAPKKQYCKLSQTNKKSRVEIRKLWCDIDNAEYLRDKLNIPDCQMILRVDRDVFDSASTLLLHDTRYFITSIDPSDVKPRDLQKLVHDHWQIKNSLHFVKDRWWDVLLRWWHKDRHYLSRPGLGTVFATLTNFALSILRLLQPPGDSLIETAENLRYSPRKILQTIGIDTE